MLSIAEVWLAKPECVNTALSTSPIDPPSLASDACLGCAAVGALWTS